MYLKISKLGQNFAISKYGQKKAEETGQNGEEAEQMAKEAKGQTNLKGTRPEKHDELGHVLELLHIVRYQIHNLTARMPLTG
jgi:hypothetical protein